MITVETEFDKKFDKYPREKLQIMEADKLLKKVLTLKSL